MIKVHVGDYQRLDAADIETKLTAWRCVRSIRALLQAAINQQAGGAVEMKLVTGTSDAARATVMGNGGKSHSTESFAA